MRPSGQATQVLQPTVTLQHPQPPSHAERYGACLGRRG